jgi:hypothetical protein
LLKALTHEPGDVPVLLIDEIDRMVVEGKGRPDGQISSNACRRRSDMDRSFVARLGRLWS